MNTDNANKFLDERQIYQRDVWDSKDIEHPLDCLLEDYHQEQLKLLGIADVSGWFLVEITKPMSTTFKQGMNAWCKYTSKRNDFKLKTLTEDYEQGFGFAYRAHFKTYH